MEIKIDNYLNVPAHARLVYDLKGNDLLLYGLIHGFSQDGHSWCDCSQQYMCDWLGTSDTKTVRTVLGRLIEVGAIEKQEVYVNNVKFCKYRANSPHRGKIAPTTGVESTDNNIKDNISINNSLSLFEEGAIEVVVPTQKVDLKFERFWKVYDKKVQKVQAEKMWKKLTEKEKDEILSRVALYVLSTPDVQYRMNPATYINPANKRWLDELRQPASQPNRPQGNYIIKDGVAHPVV